MKLNTLDLINFDFRYQEVFFTLACDFGDVADLNGQMLTVYDDDGEIKSQFGGYNLLGVERQGSFLRAHFMQALEPNIQQALTALQTNQATTQTITDAHTDQLDLIEGALEELIAFTLGD